MCKYTKLSECSTLLSMIFTFQEVELCGRSWQEPNTRGWKSPGQKSKFHLRGVWEHLPLLPWGRLHHPWLTKITKGPVWGVQPGGKLPGVEVWKHLSNSTLGRFPSPGWVLLLLLCGIGSCQAGFPPGPEQGSFQPLNTPVLSPAAGIS